MKLQNPTNVVLHNIMIWEQEFGKGKGEVGGVSSCLWVANNIATAKDISYCHYIKTFRYFPYISGFHDSLLYIVSTAFLILQFKSFVNFDFENQVKKVTIQH